MKQGGMDFHGWADIAKKMMGDHFFTDGIEEQVSNFPAYNVYKNSSEVIVLINLPYLVNLSQVQLTVHEREMHVQGNIDLGYAHMECVHQSMLEGPFDLTIALPNAVHIGKANAKYQRGILKVQLFPKLRSQGKSVHIEDI